MRGLCKTMLDALLKSGNVLEVILVPCACKGVAPPHACMWLLRAKYELSCWVGLSLPFSSFPPLPRNMAVGITVCFHKKTQVRDYMHLRVQAWHLVYEAHYPRTL